MKYSIQHYDNHAHFVQQVVNAIHHSLCVSFNHKTDSPIYLALSGGNTPQVIYQHLSQKELEWSRVQAIAGDERIVDKNSDEFNSKMIASSLIQNKAQQCQLTTFDMAKNSLPFYRTIVQKMLPLDVCILGMGIDCHTASIFHDAHNLKELLEDEDKQLLKQTASPRMRQARLSLTMPVLQQSKKIHVLIQGKEKKQALEKAFASQTTNNSPILGVALLPQTTIHYCP